MGGRGDLADTPLGIQLRAVEMVVRALRGHALFLDTVPGNGRQIEMMPIATPPMANPPTAMSPTAMTPRATPRA
jgi:hypothetical protein